MLAFLKDRFTGLKRATRRCAAWVVAFARWAVILVPLAAVVGTLCAAFLWSLDVATKARFSHPWLLFLLPVGGFAIGLLYHRVGRSVEAATTSSSIRFMSPGAAFPCAWHR